MFCFKERQLHQKLYVYDWHGTGVNFVCVFSFSHHFYSVLASEVVFVKMPLRLRKRKAKRREEYVLNRDYELEFSRVQYDADAEQRRARMQFPPPPNFNYCVYVMLVCTYNDNHLLYYDDCCYMYCFYSSASSY